MTATVALTGHPFQDFDLRTNKGWAGIDINTSLDEFFEERTRALDVAFRDAVAKGGLLGFVKTYTAISVEMLARADDKALMADLLQDGFARLVRYYLFLRKRQRPWLSGGTSVKSWQLDGALIARAQAAADKQEQDNVMLRDYDLDNDPALKAWAMENMQPLLRGYIGSPVVSPRAAIRYANATLHASKWEMNYRSHAYGDFHLDEYPYSLPLILYLSEVAPENGAFRYVEGTDGIEQNFVLRAFHQAVSHGKKIEPVDPAGKKILAQLPSVFRGGDLVGTLKGPDTFEKLKIVTMTGSPGLAFVSDGFQLVHTGGHPRVGARKALFLTFRYPQKRITDIAAKIAVRYWRFRTRRERAA